MPEFRDKVFFACLVAALIMGAALGHVLRYLDDADLPLFSLLQLPR